MVTLKTGDQCSVDFTIQMLQGDHIKGINLDTIIWNKIENKWYILEYLRTGESNIKVTPHSSHPNRYFTKNGKKFLTLWDITKTLGGRLFLINYAISGTQYEDQVRLMEVINIDTNIKNNQVTTIDQNFNRNQFSSWLRDINSYGGKDYE